MSKIPQVTAEIFVIPLEDGKYVIYAPLRRVAFVANARLVNFLADLAEGVYDGSADLDGSLIGLLRRIQLVDGSSESQPVTTFAGEPLPTSITLFLTTACNLRCTYCYASAGDMPAKSMALTTAKRGIDFVIANALKRNESRIEIAYHGGGEPTANWGVMTASLAYAKQEAKDHHLAVSAAAATNGVLRDEQIDWIIANLESVSVSYDGLPETHDKHRLTVLGSGSSGRVIHTIKRFDDVQYAYGIRVTVTRDQISLLPKSIEYICTHFRPKRIQVEPAYQLGRWSAAPSAETEEFILSYREAKRIAAKYNLAIC
jgi:uncharacterized protein